MAMNQPKHLPFGTFLLPALRAAQARSLSVISSDGERSAASLPAKQLRPILHPLRFRL